ncbi:MAG: DUF4010 domain-containing protein [archaeon]
MLADLFLQKIALSLAAGALLGLERQHAKKKSAVGMRTFALLSLLGVLCAIVSQENAAASYLAIIGFTLACIFGIGFYFAGMLKRKSMGFTTSMAIIISYILGMMAGYGMFFETIFLSVSVAVILFSKERLNSLVKNLTEREIGDLLELLIILGIIYPIMPKEATVYGITIPLFTIWLLIVLICAINFAAFLLSRKMSAKQEVEAISFLGGLASSTATLLSILEVYKKNKHLLPVMSSGFLIMNAASFVRNMFLVFVIAPDVGAIAAIPAGITIGIMMFFGLRTANKQPFRRLKIESPFNVARGVKLVATIAVIFIVLDAVKFSGTGLFVIFAFLGGLVETSATMISIASMHAEAAAKMLAAAVITAQTGGYVENVLLCRAYGGKEILKETMMPFALSLAASFVTLAAIIII